MSWFTPVASGLGTLVGSVGTLQGGRNDAAVLRANARVAQEQALRDEEAIRREGRQVIGRQAAAMAQAGGGQDAGLLRQSSIMAELDALNQRYAGQMKAVGLLSQADNVKRQSKMLAAAQLFRGGAETFTAWKTSGVGAKIKANAAKRKANQQWYQEMVSR